MSGSPIRDVELYLDLLQTEPESPSREPVPLPWQPSRLLLSQLDRAFADPRVLAAPDGTPIRDADPAEQVRTLLRFAVWLQEAPPHWLPAGYHSRAARFRFLAWSLGSRLPNPPRVDKVDVGDEVRDVTAPVAQAEARAARADWLDHLQHWEDDHWLATRHSRSPQRHEDDLRWLTTAWPRRNRPARKRPLQLHDDAATARADHRTVAQRVVEEHWISRGALLAAARAYFPDRPLWLATPLVGPLIATVPPVLLLIGRSDLARCAALAIVLAAALATTTIPPSYTALGLIRLPAAIAVGQVLLLSMTPRWWLAPQAWAVGVGVLGLSLGYLVYDSRAHGSRGRLAVLRGSGLLAIGAAYAATISIAVLGFLAPAVAERGECLSGWWSHDALHERGLPNTACAEKLDLDPGAAVPAAAGVVTLMTGWSLGIGLAAQILWDDRPVSAPLGRVRRTKGTG